MNRARLVSSALGCAACILMSDQSGSLAADPSWQEAIEGTPPRLREPWVDRAVDLGVFSPAGIQVFSDGDPGQSLRLVKRVASVRAAFAAALGVFPMRKPEAPRLLVFEDLGELRFTLRTAFGAEVPEVSAVFVDHPDGGVLAVTTHPDSPRGSERALQAAAFRQYAEPRFGDALPPWAEVGLAEYFAETLFTEVGWDSGHASSHAIQLLRRAEASDRILPLGRLIRLTPEQWKSFETTHGAGLLHAEAWSLVQFMLHGNGGRLARGFSEWLEHVSAGSDPTTSFEAIFTAADGGASMQDVEDAWHASINSLEPSQVLGGLERIELLRIALEDLEREGVRPEQAEALVEALAERPPVEHTFFRHPYERTISSRESGFLDPSELEFLPARSRLRESKEAPSPAPPPIRLTGPWSWDIRIQWRFDQEQAQWVPWVSSSPGR